MIFLVGVGAHICGPALPVDLTASVQALLEVAPETSGDLVMVHLDLGPLPPDWLSSRLSLCDRGTSGWPRTREPSAANR